MNGLPEPIPKWRIVMWGVIAAIAVDAIFYSFRNTPRASPVSPWEYLAGPFCGTFIIGFGFMLLAVREYKKKLLEGSIPREKLKRHTTFILTLIGIFGTLLGFAFLFRAVLGIYNGHVSEGGRHTHGREVYLSQQPHMFWFQICFDGIMGVYILYGTFKIIKK